MKLDRRIGWACLAAFVACVWAANYAITHWGTAPSFPGGPYTVTIGGLTAPSGVLVVGLSFTFRDLAQMSLGKWWVWLGIGAGIGLSALTASPGLAAASCAAFALGEGLDWCVYTPLADSGHWFSGVAASNTVGSLVDSVVFLWVAFGSLEFLAGQFWLKLLMTVPALIVLAPFRLRQRAVVA